MLTRRSHTTPSSEITPRDRYLRRRDWLRLAAAGSLASLSGALTACSPGADEPGSTLGLGKITGAHTSPLSTDEAITAYRHATTYNNYYEFGTGKSDPASYARQLSGEPWTVVKRWGAIGKVSVDMLEKVSRAAIQLERVGGQAASDTVKEFAALGDEPVKAVLKLDEKYHFLTASVLEQVKALSEQGRETDAARLAQTSFFDALQSRIPALENQLGTLEVRDGNAQTRRTDDT